MILSKVVGNIVATQKQECYEGCKLLLIRPLGLDGKMYGDDMLAIDGVGAGIDDIVIAVNEGGSARDILGHDGKLEPIELVICGIVDTVITDQGSINQFGK